MDTGENDWIPACAGMNGVTGSIRMQPLEQAAGWLTTARRDEHHVRPTSPPLLTREPAAMTQHQKLDPSTIHDTPAQVSDLLNLHEIVAKARQNLNQNDWDYIVGGAESETTLRRNRMALETVAFRPRILRDVSNVDASTTQFGR
jgi:FMN-dependent dehydrogenase